jgi:hypothetical protein
LFEANQERVRLNGKHQLLVCADDIILLGKDRLQTKATALFADRELRPEEHAEDTTLIFMS